MLRIPAYEAIRSPEELEIAFVYEPQGRLGRDGLRDGCDVEARILRCAHAGPFLAEVSGPDQLAISNDSDAGCRDFVLRSQFSERAVQTRLQRWNAPTRRGGIVWPSGMT